MRPTASETALQPETDEELVRALQNGRTETLGTLYDRYASLVCGLALAILHSPQEAEDLTQDVFLTLCRKWEYDPARGPLRGFFITLTRSRAIDKLRVRQRNARFLKRWRDTAPPEGSSRTALEELSVAQCAQQVRKALAQLPDNQRRVLELAYYKGLSQGEIAAQLGAPLGTVKSWTRRGLLNLQHALRDLVSPSL